MLLTELPEGCSISLMVNVNGTPLTFPSRVQEVNAKRNYILADAVVKEGKPVSFRGEKVSLSILYTVDNAKPLIFRNVASKLFQKKNESYCYMFTVNDPSVEYNRRGNFRCIVDVESNAQFGFNSAAHSVVIRDVSITGFAVICSNKVKADIGQFVHTVLNDQVEVNGTLYSFHLFGLVTRKQELENNKVLYGCQLNHAVNGLNKYIMEKERVRLRH